MLRHEAFGRCSSQLNMYRLEFNTNINYEFYLLYRNRYVINRNIYFWLDDRSIFMYVCMRASLPSFNTAFQVFQGKRLRTISVGMFSSVARFVIEHPQQ